MQQCGKVDWPTSTHFDEKPVTSMVKIAPFLDGFL
jgi:hypothetical protein